MSKQDPASNFTRPCANFRPSVWGDIFLQYDHSESLEDSEDNVKKQVQIHKQEVKKMFLTPSNSVLQKLNFIDSIQHLGVSYHFKYEIDQVLKEIYNNFINNNLNIEKDDLYYTALLFRLLRQQGYNISSDIFNKFKNNQGKFKEAIGHDVQGMWKFYEATQLRIHGEDILEEAIDFTCINLKSMMTNNNEMNPSLVSQINHSLRQPLHKEVPRIEARRYLPLYEEDPSHSKVLLTFAKLDFNVLQKLHQKEIGIITKWWKSSEFVKKVPYIRDRVVEAYFWPLAMSYDPKHSTARILAGKFMGIISLLDDTYDAYGTIEELELFTEAIKRWDIRPINSLPECMKVVFNAILEMWYEMELVTSKGENSSLVLQHIKQAFCNLARTYLVEAKWCHEGYIPTYDEYKVNGTISSTLPLQIITFLGLGGFATKEVFDWIMSDPKIVKAVSLIGRLMDDMASHKFEQQRVHVASSVECCMKQYNISQEKAYKLIHNEVEDFWMDINEECLMTKNIPKPVLDSIINLARIIEFTYANFEDKYTHGELLKDYVVALFLDPVSI